MGAHQYAGAELILRNVRGEALKKALGEEFSPEELVNEGSKEDIAGEKY